VRISLRRLNFAVNSKKERYVDDENEEIKACIVRQFQTISDSAAIKVVENP
jgi:hypothetical protein